MIGANKVEVGDHKSSYPDFDKDLISCNDTNIFYYSEPWRWDHDKLGHGTTMSGIILSSIKEH
jgi:hypothetical protein